MNDNFEYLTQELKRLTHLAMHVSERTHSAIFKDKPNESAIIGYLNYASTLIGTAKAIYISNFDILAHNDIEDFFNQFDVFAMEVLSNVEDDPTHQWSDIEYQKLKEEYDQCVLSK